MLSHICTTGGSSFKPKDFTGDTGNAFLCLSTMSHNFFIRTFFRGMLEMHSHPCTRGGSIFSSNNFTGHAAMDFRVCPTVGSICPQRKVFAGMLTTHSHIRRQCGSVQPQMILLRMLAMQSQVPLRGGSIFQLNDWIRGALSALSSSFTGCQNFVYKQVYWSFSQYILPFV